MSVESEKTMKNLKLNLCVLLYSLSLVPEMAQAQAPTQAPSFMTRFRERYNEAIPPQPVMGTYGTSEFSPVEGPEEEGPFTSGKAKLMRFRGDPELEMAEILNRSEAPESGIDITSMDAAFIPGSSDGEEIKRHNTLKVSGGSLNGACDQISEDAKTFCQETFSEYSVNAMIGMHESSLLTNQGVHDRIKGVIAKHSAQGLATSAAGALSALQEGKIKKSIKKIKEQQNAAQVEAFQPTPVEVQFCQAQPNDPRCQGNNTFFKPRAASFAGFNGVNVNTGTADTTIDRGPASEAQNEFSTTAPDRSTVSAPLITDAAVVNKGDNRLVNVPAPARVTSQATASRGAAGGASGAGGGAPSLPAGSGEARAPSNYNPRADVSYDGGFGGKAQYAGTSATGKSAFNDKKDNPFGALFGGKTGSGTETFDASRGPASQIADNSKSIWDRVSGRFKVVVDEKRIDLPKP